MVECNLAKVEVASSNLVSRSIFLQLDFTGMVRRLSGLFFIDRLKISLYKLTVYFRGRISVFAPSPIYIKLKAYL